eukprot:1138307-Pelagomonas_calceolata.AAC.5
MTACATLASLGGAMASGYCCFQLVKGGWCHACHEMAENVFRNFLLYSSLYMALLLRLLRCIAGPLPHFRLSNCRSRSRRPSVGRLDC